MNRIILIVSLAFALPWALEPLLGASWEVKSFGNASSFTQGVRLGSGINGASIRLYAVSGWGGDGKGYEWTYGESQWTSQAVYTGLGICYSPLLATLREDGAWRLYVGSYTRTTAYEVALQTGQWSSVAIAGSTMEPVLCLRAGPGRNDGIERLYLACGNAGAQGGLYEFTWNGAGQSWDKLKIHGRDVGEFALADGRSDGILRIYAGAREGGDGGVLEFTWNGSQYEAALLSFPGILQAGIQTTHVGDGRGDGKKRVYVNEWNGRLFELTYDAGAWSSLQVAGAARRFYLASGRLRPDNQSRVYASVQGSGVREHTWNGSSFEQSVDVVTAATGGLVIGNGRNDGKNRLYVGRGGAPAVAASVAEASDPNPPDSDPSLGPRFRRGDANDDGVLDISDAAFSLLHVFGGRAVECEDAADANDDGIANVADPIRILGYLFGGAPAPPSPGSACGADSTDDALGCAGSARCP